MAKRFEFRRRKPTRFVRKARGIPTLRDHHTAVSAVYQANVLVPFAAFLGPFEVSTAVDEVLIAATAAVISVSATFEIGEFSSECDESEWDRGRPLVKGASGGTGQITIQITSGDVNNGVGGATFFGSVPVYHRFTSACPFLGVRITTSDDVWGWVGCRSQLEP